MNLLGKDFSQLMPEAIYLNNVLLHDINMGYEDAKKIRAGSSVRFNRMEAAYIHPWSYENIGEQYGMNKLNDYIPIRDYLELPSNAVDRIVAGIIKGKEERLKLDDKRRLEREAKDKAVNKANVHSQNIDPMTAEVMRQLEIDKQ